MVFIILLERYQSHHHSKVKAETYTRVQVLEKFNSVEEFKASLTEPSECSKFVSTLQNFNDVYLFLIPAEWFLKKSFNVQLKGCCFRNFS